MVCVHLFGMARFLRIAFGAEKVRAAFCVTCSDCVEAEALISFSDTEDEKTDNNSKKKMRAAIMKEIEEENAVVKECDIDRAKEYMSVVRPLIEVGNNSLAVVGWA